jgi:hypothetical protein
MSPTDSENDQWADFFSSSVFIASAWLFKGSFPLYFSLAYYGFIARLVPNKVTHRMHCSKTRF